MAEPVATDALDGMSRGVRPAVFDRTDAFVHISAVERAGFRDLREGDKVSYELVADKRSGKQSADQLKDL